MKHLKKYKIFEGSDDFRKEMDNLQQTRTELIDQIKIDCAPFLELSKTCRYPLQFLRGTSQEWLDRNGEKLHRWGCWKVNHNWNRMPIDSPNWFHNELNKELESKFHWPVRNGVFALRNYLVAIEYSKRWTRYPEAYIMIPIGDFEFCYSKRYKDVWGDLKDYILDGDVDVKEVAETYTDKNIEGAGVGNGCHEVSFKCDSYYMLGVSGWSSLIFD
jgi:hypothetical protein